MPLSLCDWGVLKMETMTGNLPLKQRIQAVHQKIQEACERAGRDPKSVRLMLVTKTVAAEQIRNALACGETLLGENKVQEALSKLEALQDTSAEWHFIGHLQTNKIKDVLRFAQMIQSVDRLDLAQKLNQRLDQEGRRLDILLQINTSYEDSKSGIRPEQARELIQRIAELPALQIRGLMTIGLFSERESAVRDCFRRLTEIQAMARSLNLPGTSWEVLSMGMSGDFEWAIEEGSTLIRIGTSIFGART